MKNPNIIFFTIDGLRADKFEGNDKSSITPNLDSLRKKGTYFSQAISCADGTTLALNAMFSGMFPFRTGTRAKEVQIISSNFIHILKNNGFHIYGVIPNLTSLSRYKFTFENSVNSFKATPPNIEHLWEGAGKKILNLFEPGRMKEPWFCYIHPLDLHDPLIVQDEFNNEKFGDSKYEKVLSSMDKWIGDITKHVDLDKTIIIITADHGSIIPKGDLEYVDFEPEFKTGLNIGKKLMPHSTHKIGMKIFVGLRNRIRDSRLKKANEGLTPYQKRSRLPHTTLLLNEEIVRVPLIFVGANTPKNKIIHELVRTVDIFPTIFNILGIDDSTLKDKDGRSLVPMVEDKKLPELPAYFITNPHKEITVDDKVGIRTSKYKYFPASIDQEKEINLYELENDHQENNNIASENPEIVKEMEGILEKLTKNVTIDESEKLTEDQEKIIEKQLKEMGYI